MMFIIIAIILGVTLLIRGGEKKESKQAPMVGPTEAEKARVADLEQRYEAELANSGENGEELKRIEIELNEARLMAMAIKVQPQELTKVAEKKQGVDGLSLALYGGSLLVLAGVGGLVASGERGVGLLLLIALMVLFYGGGLLLRNNATLKVASYVFVGTGMVILPFIGMLAEQMITEGTLAVAADITGVAWIVTSLIWMGMGLVATAVMRSRVFGYATVMAGVLLAMAIAHTAGGNVAWQGVAVVIWGLVLDALGRVKMPERLEELGEVIAATREWVPAAVLGAYALTVWEVDVKDAIVMLTLAAVQMGVDLKLKPSLVREGFLRIALMWWLLLVAGEMSSVVASDAVQTVDVDAVKMKWIGVALLLGAAAQALYSFWRITRSKRSVTGESGWLIAMMACFLGAGALMSVDTSVQEYCAGMLVMCAIDVMIMVLARVMTKRSGWGFGMIAAGVAIPILLSGVLGWLEGDAAKIYYTAWYLIELIGALALCLGLKQPKELAITAGVVYGVAVIGVSGLATSWMVLVVAGLALIGIVVVALVRKSKKTENGGAGSTKGDNKSIIERK